MTAITANGKSAQQRRKAQMIDTNTLAPTDAPDLLQIARETGLRTHLQGVSATDARALLKAFVDALPPAPASQPVAVPAGTVEHDSTSMPAEVEAAARIEGIDEYGPRLEWRQHWVDVGVGAKLFTAAQVQAMLAAAPSGPAREPLTDDAIEAAWSDLQERRATKASADFNARIGLSCSQCGNGTYRADSNGYSSFHRCSKCHHVPMWKADGT